MSRDEQVIEVADERSRSTLCRIGAAVRTLEIVRRLTGCYYCGRPIRGRAEVCGYCSDLPLRDPLVVKARQPLTEAERIAASR